ncbi:hypothetical protein R3W88_016025 [Solanum pinnatisectum]|uniref:Thylakoid soluble phosphoprotein TSP9 n=1 Tax=Solanum pinnatisectum TaxID=50273 RepID=A0AAV9L0H3_9SOLN|nr:hypothetical protein R3W88_016025 [Solanum pinnatisectum]
MASLNLFVPPIATTTQRRIVYTRATSTKSSGGGSSEEKSILDFVLGALQKEDQLLETDPIMKKVEGRSGTTTSFNKKSVSIPPPKKDSNGFGGFGSLFAKK